MAGANNEYPLIDGVAPSWADVIVRIQTDGAPVLVATDIKSINSGTTIEVGEQRAGGRVKQTTTGSASHEGSMTLYLSGAQAFERALSAVAQAKGYVRDGGVVQLALVRFQIDYMYTPPGSTEIFERRLKGVRALGDSEAASEGNDALTADYKLHILERVKVIDGVEVAWL